MSDNKGYVYILTNKAFREDWVKIGKSSRPVDVRSKELYNTAVPLPYEIYATVKTSKYDELESRMHEILQDLAGLRINEKREFFRILPQDAFKHLAGLARLIDDAEINGPDEEDEGDGEHGTRTTMRKGGYSVNYDGIFHMVGDTFSAKMVVKNGKFVVLEGAKIDPEISSNEKTIRKSREENHDKLDESGLVVISDIELDSPSAAACFVRGGASNGKYYWRSEEDKPLADYIKYSK